MNERKIMNKETMFKDYQGGAFEQLELLIVDGYFECFDDIAYQIFGAKSIKRFENRFSLDPKTECTPMERRLVERWIYSKNKHRYKSFIYNWHKNPDLVLFTDVMAGKYDEILDGEHHVNYAILSEVDKINRGER